MKEAALGSKYRVSSENADQTVLPTRWGVGLLAPVEDDVAVAIHRNAQVRSIPLRQGPGIFRLEEHASETRHSAHRAPPHVLISFSIKGLSEPNKYYRRAKKPFRCLLRTKPVMKLNF
jgi:hypothetical protein